jgi:trans-aconitate methyltransferase
VSQDAVFRGGEGDAWYRRNADALAGRRSDPTLAVIGGLDRRAEVTSVCDLGCADGWRLDALRPLLPAARRLAGLDASTEAVAAGRTRSPDLELRVGTLAAHDLAGPFDLAIVNAVLHWVDRGALADSLAGIDRVVAPGGVLVLADFAPDGPAAVPYHHRTDVALKTYKQDYAALFRGLGTYRETFRLECGHADLDAGRAVPSRWVPSDERWGVSVLVKAG